MEQYVKYLRKSRFDRDYAELSIEETLKRHEAILDKLASDRGYYIAKTYYEVVSGESIAARPEIQKLLEEVSAGLYVGVLVVDLERLARGNGADQAYISQVFQYSGTKIITPLKDYDPTNEFDEEYFEFGLFMSRREYKTITRRLIRGRESSASEGKYINSIAPYGYRRVKLPAEKGYTLEPEPEEADVIKKMFQMLLDNAGIRTIANYLNDLKIPTRHGAIWTYSTVRNILSNPVYMGKIRRGMIKQVKSIGNGVVTKRKLRYRNMKDYQLYDGLHPALVSEEDFMKAQGIRAGLQPTAKVKDKFELKNAFAGLLYCAVCGKRIVRTTTSKKKNSIPRFRCENMRICHNSSAPYVVVEKEIIAALREWLKGYKVKIDTVGFDEEISAYRNLLEKNNLKMADLEKQMDTAYNLVEQGVYTIAVFKDRKAKLTAEKRKLETEQERIQHLLEQLEESNHTRSNLIPQTEALLASYDSMTNQERNDLLKTILYKIIYRKQPGSNKIEIDLYPRLPRL